jgi:hypothetical protein
MSDKGLDTDRAEQIKWCDALDALSTRQDVERGLQMARECRHPDAVWLASLFPVGLPVSRARMREVMLEDLDDPRAMHLAYELDVSEEGRDSEDLPRRAAEMDYVPAYATLSVVLQCHCNFEESLLWAQRAASLNDRTGLCQLAFSFQDGSSGPKDKQRALELYKEAAELGSALGMFSYGVLAHECNEWQQYEWMSRAVAKGHYGLCFCDRVLWRMPQFEQGRDSRILHIAAQTIRVADCDLATKLVFGERMSRKRVRMLQRLLELHDVLLGRAREAIGCWSVVARRRGMTRDARVMIAKMLWEQPWQWGAKDSRGGVSGWLTAAAGWLWSRVA